MSLGRSYASPEDNDAVYGTPPIPPRVEEVKMALLPGGFGYPEDVTIITVRCILSRGGGRQRYGVWRLDAAWPSRSIRGLGNKPKNRFVRMVKEKLEARLGTPVIVGKGAMSWEAELE